MTRSGRKQTAERAAERSNKMAPLNAAYTPGASLNQRHYNAASRISSSSQYVDAADALAAANHGEVINLAGALSRNKFVEPDLSSISKIKYLNLSRNKRTQFDLRFQLPSIIELNMASNLLSRFHIASLNNMSSLTALNLSDNNLQNFLEADTLERMPKLLKLNLSNNSIERISEDAAKELSRMDIKELNLSDNRLMHLPAEIGEVTTLEYLDLSNNELSRLPPEIRNLSYLYRSARCFNIRGNNLVAPPQQIAERRGLKSVEDYFFGLLGPRKLPTQTLLQLLTCGMAPWNDMQMVSPAYGLSTGNDVTAPSSTRSSRRTRPGKSSLRFSLQFSDHQQQQIQQLAQNSIQLPSNSSFESLAFTPTPATGASNNLFRISSGYDLNSSRSSWSQGMKRTGSQPVRENFDSNIATSIDSVSKNRVGGIDPDLPGQLLKSMTDNKHQRSSSLHSKGRHLKMVVLGGPGVGKSAIVRALNDFNPGDEQQRENNQDFSGTLNLTSAYRQKVLKNRYPQQYENFLPFDASIKITIWDFVGTEIYHAAYEMFFSEQALHLLAWDIRSCVQPSKEEYLVNTIKGNRDADDCISPGIASKESSTLQSFKQVDQLLNEVHEQQQQHDDKEKLSSSTGTTVETKIDNFLIDKNVQFWIDLIQARAPGATILIVATNTQSLPAEEVQKRCFALQQRLAKNESIRKDALRNDIIRCNEDRQKKSRIKRLLNMRPKIHHTVVPFELSPAVNSSGKVSANVPMSVFCNESMSSDFTATPTTLSCAEKYSTNTAAHIPLVEEIVALVSPRKRTALDPLKLQPEHPFGVINIDIPYYYQTVKMRIRELRRIRTRNYCTITELHEKVKPPVRSSLYDLDNDSSSLLGLELGHGIQSSSTSCNTSVAKPHSPSNARSPSLAATLLNHTSNDSLDECDWLRGLSAQDMTDTVDDLVAPAPSQQASMEVKEMNKTAAMASIPLPRQAVENPSAALLRVCADLTQYSNSYSQTKNAIVYWASVGEIFWFPATAERDSLSVAHRLDTEDKLHFNVSRPTAVSDAMTSIDFERDEKEGRHVETKSRRRRRMSEIQHQRMELDKCTSMLTPIVVTDISSAIQSERNSNKGIEAHGTSSISAREIEQNYTLADDTSGTGNSTADSDSSSTCSSGSSSEADIGAFSRGFDVLAVDDSSMEGEENETHCDVSAVDGLNPDNNSYVHDNESSSLNQCSSQYESIQEMKSENTSQSVKMSENEVYHYELNMEQQFDTKAEQSEDEEIEQYDLLSNIIFVSPIWLKRTMAGVMGKDRMTEIEKNWRLAPKNEQQHFASDQNVRQNFVRGVVRWDMIKNFLKETRTLDLEDEENALDVLKELLIRLAIIIPITKHCSASTSNAIAGHNRLEMKNPKKNSGVSDFGHAENDSSSTSSNDDDAKMEVETSDSSGDHFLLPALLEPSPSEITSDFPQKRFIRLERRFTFKEFVPSGLVPRVIARMYSRFGTLLRQSALDSEKNRCFQSSFIQEYGNCTVYVMLCDSSPNIRSPHCGNDGADSAISSSKTTPSYTINDVTHNSTVFPRVGESSFFEERIVAHYQQMRDEYMLDDSETYLQYVQDFLAALDARKDRLQSTPTCSTDVPQDNWDVESNTFSYQGALGDPQLGSGSRLVELRLISYGHLLHTQSAVVESLYDYISVVHELLDQYQGVNHLTADAVCPICLMKQLPDEECGRFFQQDLDLLSKSLTALCTDKNLADLSSLRNAYLSWEKAWRLRCPAHGCNVRADFLVCLPRRIRDALNSREQYELLVQYLAQDVINPARIEDEEEPLVPDMDKHHSSLVEIGSAIVQVMRIPEDIAHNASRRMEHLFSDPELTSPQFSFLTPVGNAASGACVHAPMDGELWVGSSGSKCFGNFKCTEKNCTQSPLIKAILTSHLLTGCNSRVNEQDLYLIADSTHWLYLAKPMMPTRTADSFGSFCIAQESMGSFRGPSDIPNSDALLLQLVVPIEPIPIGVDGNKYLDVRCRCSAGVQLDAPPVLWSAQSFCDSYAPTWAGALGGEFHSLSLSYPTLNVESEGIPFRNSLSSDYFWSPTPQSDFDSLTSCMNSSAAFDCSAHGQEDGFMEPLIEVEQTVTVWGYSEKNALNGGSWARVVRKCKQLYVINLYSDEVLVGGPVLNNDGRVIGIVSIHPYKEGKQSAYYMATLKDVFI